jgi:hypothetical protein
MSDDEALTEKIVKEALDLTTTKGPAGLMVRRIREDGIYEEAGLVVTEEDLRYSQHYAVLAILAKGMNDYLALNPRDDAAEFHTLIELVNRKDKQMYGPGAFPEYRGLPYEVLPPSLASLVAEAASGKPSLHGLDDPDLVHEWTTKPGMRLFKLLVERLRSRSEAVKRICAPGGIADLLRDGKMGESQVIMAVVQSLLLILAPGQFWIPLAVVASTVLVKRGLTQFCGNVVHT